MGLQVELIKKVTFLNEFTVRHASNFKSLSDG
jgi:hypothetical protein